MQKQGEQSKLQKLTQMIAPLLKLPWLSVIDLVLQMSQRFGEFFQSDGLYEVLEYKVTLEIHDRQGKKATVNKRQKVRYLQNHIVAYQDQAWGDGEILIDYKCTPGVPVDRYRFGHKTIILISLRDEKTKNKTDEFLINWQIMNGFLKETESWATSVQHKTQQVAVNLIFPATRHPKQISLIESMSKKSQVLENSAVRKLPDGRWLVSWHRFKPKVDEEYLLEWKW